MERNSSPQYRYKRSAVIPWVLLWGLLSSALVTVSIIIGVAEIAIITAALSIYTLIAFVSEFLGVSLSNPTISFPNRLVIDYPFLTLGRSSLRLSDIYQVRSYTSEGVQKCLIITAHGSRKPIYFPNKIAKYAFLSSITEYDSHIDVVKSVN